MAKEADTLKVASTLLNPEANKQTTVDLLHPNQIRLETLEDKEQDAHAEKPRVSEAPAAEVLEDRALAEILERKPVASHSRILQRVGDAF